MSLPRQIHCTSISCARDHLRGHCCSPQFESAHFLTHRALSSTILQHDAMLARCIVHTRVCLSVCLSVCSSQVLWKRLNVSYLYAVQFVCENIPANECYTFLANVNSRLRSLYAIARPSVCRLSSVTPVRPTQALQIFCDISTTFGTMAIH